MRTVAAVVALCAAGSVVWAEPAPIKVGVLTDMSGPSASSGGMGSVQAARMAAAEFHDVADSRPVRIVYADHGGKPDTGAAVAGRWFDEEMADVIADMQGSPIGLAVQNVASPRRKIMLLSASTSSDFTGKTCSPWTVQWTVDAYALAVGAAQAMTGLGAKSWFFTTVDQAYGHALSRDMQAQARAPGGRVAGEAVFAPGSADFASLLLQAQASGADVLAFASSSGATETLAKQAAEFGAGRPMRIIALQPVPNDICGIGLQAAQGLYGTSPFHWDRTPQTRAWSEAFFARTRAMPSGFQAGVYSSVRAYPRAVVTARSNDPAAVMAALRAAPVDDVFASDGRIRADGKMAHDLCLLQVKAPAKSHGPWDFTT